MNIIADKAVWPKDAFYAIPYNLYVDPQAYEQEQEHLFRGPTWNYIALEAEIPNPGDYKSTFVGDTPVVVARGKDGKIHGWVNRCAHRGALVCRDLRGNAETFTCVYHQWSFAADGSLIGVPFRRGISGKGGYPKDFKLEEHGLTTLHLDSYRGVIFASFDSSLKPVAEYISPELTWMMDRIFNRPLKILGHHRQFMQGNWKFYADNTRDPYHGSLLHLFHATFGTYRSSQIGQSITDETGMHSLLTATRDTDAEKLEEYKQEKLRTYQEGYALSDPSVLAGKKEFPDDISLVIFAIFPNLVVQQIVNTLAVRQVLPKAADAMELVWTYFGYSDDDEEMTNVRLKQINLIGPAGLISMEDGEAVEICHKGTRRDPESFSCVELDGRDVHDADHLVTEAPIRGFWKAYRQILGL